MFKMAPTNEVIESHPHTILLFSGKRKCGKDFLTNEFLKLYGIRTEVIRISQPIKSHWAKEKNLNLNELLSDSEYKEQYREAMIQWSDEMRAKDYGCFCRAACDNAQAKGIWLVSDIRRKTDINWFQERYQDLVKTIRITANEETRRKRGYVFRKGIDDVTSECDLDDYVEWDVVIDNSEGNNVSYQLDRILELLPKL